MVYSAMKLFMEINPSLFDECTTDYAALQESAPARLAERESIWKALEEKAARKRKDMDAPVIAYTANPSVRLGTGSPMQITTDGATDSQKKMDALDLKDDGSNKAVGHA